MKQNEFQMSPTGIITITTASGMTREMQVVQSDKTFRHRIHYRDQQPDGGYLDHWDFLQVAPASGSMRKNKEDRAYESGPTWWGRKCAYWKMHSAARSFKASGSVPVVETWVDVVPPPSKTVKQAVEEVKKVTNEATDAVLHAAEPALKKIREIGDTTVQNIKEAASHVTPNPVVTITSETHKPMGAAVVAAEEAEARREKSDAEIADEEVIRQFGLKNPVSTPG